MAAPSEPSDRRVPTNADLLAVLYETRSEVTILQARMTAVEQRQVHSEQRTEGLREVVEDAVHRLDEHMLCEERDRAALLRRINAVLLAVLGALGLAVLDLIVNYLGKG